MARLKVIDIVWDGPFKILHDEKTWDYVIPPLPGEIGAKSGFYCIFGRHPVYGPDVLLYIGETKPNAKGTRSFSSRIREHLKGRFYEHTNLSVFLGTPQTVLTPEKIKAAESILIAAHKPALNRRHIDGSTKESRGCVLRNYGFISSLFPECSGDYWATEV